MSEIKMTPEQIKAILSQFDITTFEGWVGAAIELLKDKPRWTALVNRVNGTYLAVFDDVLHFSFYPEYTGDEILPVEKPADWIEEDGSLVGCTPEQTVHVLLFPEFFAIDNQVPEDE